MKAIEILHCCIAGIASRRDHGLNIRFETPELLPSQAQALLPLHGVNVTVSIVPEDMEPDELIRVTQEKSGKTPSQRLRAILHVYWKQCGEKESFDSFYDHHMEKLIDFVRTKLEPN